MIARRLKLKRCRACFGVGHTPNAGEARATRGRYWMWTLCADCHGSGWRPVTRKLPWWRKGLS